MNCVYIIVTSAVPTRLKKTMLRRVGPALLGDWELQ